MKKLQPVRGTHDFLPSEMRHYRHVVDTSKITSTIYGFEEVQTPIFEFDDVFKRTLGDTSDVVSKEMYSFQDRGGDLITLRPENTASICRMLLSNGLLQDWPQKFFYAGPMFRYERPQKGRMRQFHQIGIEFLGSKTFLADIEIIALGWAILKNLHIADSFKLEINTLGDYESRQNYRQKLVEYLQDYRHQLSPESQIRLERNPLRILDSKDSNDQTILKNAPLYTDSLNTVSRDFFSKILEGLNYLNIPYVINSQLVRGLDYYCHTCFEITCEALGAQKTLLAGGRYDGLMAMLGNVDVPGVGWAAGVERLMLVAPPPSQIDRPIVVIAADEDSILSALTITETLRAHKIKSHFVQNSNLGKSLKKADKLDCKYVLLIGETERKNAKVTLRDLDQGHQIQIDTNNLVAVLKNEYIDVFLK
ncbi:MAG: histidine--tRNA ligase [Alphaproteobacteria bacterium]|nr:histidine--tRNA ligase [Alphaproteobacteria bacterium]